MATYLHIDVDAFLAAVEQSINKHLQGRPVMVGGARGERGIVYCPSYEARARGVRLGTSLHEAAQLIPDGIFLKGDSFTYEDYSHRLMNILGDFTPLVEKISSDEACLDISGFKRHFRSEDDLATQIKARVRKELNLSTSIGIGSSRVVAKIASEIKKPDGLTIIAPGTEKDFLAPLPVERIPGIGPVGRRLLNEMAVRTIGQLQRIPESYLVTIFGQNGRKFAAHAAGCDGFFIRDQRAIRSVNRETGLAKDITDDKLLLSHYYYLIERACRRLRRIRKKAARMTVRFRYCDFEQFEGHISVSPTWDERVLYGHARHMFGVLHGQRKGIRFVGVTLSNLKNAVFAESFIPDRTEKGERLLESIDDIRARFGFLAITTGRTINLEDCYERKVTGYELRTPGLSQ